jgi:4-hydroxythreonine-4-phosphate dehydrogenase
MKRSLPSLAITLGDPAGIGPEILIKALCRGDLWRLCRPVVVGDPGVMERACALLGVSRTVRTIQAPEEAGEGNEIPVLPAAGESLEGIPMGRLDPRCGRAQVAFIRLAVDLALGGRVAGLVTGPINKQGLRLAGVTHPGHTEMLAHWTGATQVAMMLAGDHLRVVPVTLHVPLRDAISQISVGRIGQCIRLTHQALRDWFGFPSPRLAVSGLNPHAGEGGLFGVEEGEIIEPAVEAARTEGLDVDGPLPPDAVFHMAAAGRYQAVIAMYHDQGLIPLKLLDRDSGVNLTLGLPILRTSVDHGTAYDLAGTGRASEGSMVAAITLAARLATRRGASATRDPSTGEGAPA